MENSQRLYSSREPSPLAGGGGQANSIAAVTFNISAEP